MVLRERLDNHGDPLPAADAGGGEAVARVAAPQFEQQRQNEARAAGRQRMAESDRAAVHIYFIAIEAELFFDGEILRREGFIYFDEIHLLELQPGCGQRLLR